jgi:phosphatidylinositol alpha-1,6-mannosyltransferase
LGKTQQNKYMKKILVITLEFPNQIGGIATFVHQLSNAFDPSQVVVLAPEMAGGAEWDKSNAKYKILRKHLLFPKLIWPRWLKLFFIARKIIKNEKIELILIHHILPVGYVGWIITKLYKIPYIIFSHGTDILAGTSTKWKKKMMKIVMRSSEQLIFNSESLKRRLLMALPEFEQKSSVMYPCPEEEFFYPANEEEVKKLRSRLALEGKKVILSVSRIDDGKGFPHLVRILPKVLEQIANLVWVIIGDGPKKDEVYKEIQELNLQNVVRYIGEMPHDELKKYYYLADLFVLLTHPDNGKEEGLGLVFLEASACGLPIIAGRSGGVEEAVIHSHTGVIVDVRQNPQSVSEAIVTLLQNKEFASKLGQNAQDRIKSDFLWKNQIKVLDKWL